jgi:endo-1,4-beta-xylanase
MKIQYFLLFALFLMACGEEEVTICTDETALSSLADFPIGVAVSPFQLDRNAAYRDIVTKQFNSITPGNIFKSDALQPFEGVFEFDAADALVAFAMQTDKRIHGHTLLWHNQLPSWMNNFSGSREDWIEMMKTHIQTILTHFKGKVKSWDVVNEAFEDNGDFRENIWFENIGEEYLELAFEFAHEADSTILLFYNDYSIALRNSKCRAILEHFDGLKLKGVQVDGIGLQLHIFTRIPTNNEIENAVDAIAEKGYLIHFSEIDISMNLTGGGMNLTTNRLERQARKMRALTNIFQTIPKEQQFGMTVWGVSDLDSWIPSFFEREDYPLLYDENYEPKLMYCGFLEGLTD